MPSATCSKRYDWRSRGSFLVYTKVSPSSGRSFHGLSAVAPSPPAAVGDALRRVASGDRAQVLHKGGRNRVRVRPLLPNGNLPFGGEDVEATHLRWGMLLQDVGKPQTFEDLLPWMIGDDGFRERRSVPRRETPAHRLGGGLLREPGLPATSFPAKEQQLALTALRGPDGLRDERELLLSIDERRKGRHGSA